MSNKNKTSNVAKKFHLFFFCFSFWQFFEEVFISTCCGTMLRGENKKNVTQDNDVTHTKQKFVLLFKKTVEELLLPPTFSCCFTFPFFRFRFSVSELKSEFRRRPDFTSGHPQTSTGSTQFLWRLYTKKARQFYEQNFSCKMV